MEKVDIPHFVKAKQKTLQSICAQLSVKQLYVFGSVLTQDFNQNSDIDFLVRFDQSLSTQQYATNYFLLHEKLETIYARPVDVVTENMLGNPYFIEMLNQSKRLIYEA